MCIYIIRRRWFDSSYIPVILGVISFPRVRKIVQQSWNGLLGLVRDSEVLANQVDQDTLHNPKKKKKNPFNWKDTFIVPKFLWTKARDRSVFQREKRKAHFLFLSQTFVTLVLDVGPSLLLFFGTIYSQIPFPCTMSYESPCFVPPKVVYFTILWKCRPNDHQITTSIHSHFSLV